MPPIQQTQHPPTATAPTRRRRPPRGHICWGWGGVIARSETERRGGGGGGNRGGSQGEQGGGGSGGATAGAPPPAHAVAPINGRRHHHPRPRPQQQQQRHPGRGPRGRRMTTSRGPMTTTMTTTTATTKTTAAVLTTVTRPSRRRRLWVQVVAARNVETRQGTLDAYCVVRLGPTRTWRSPTVTALAADPRWGFTVEAPFEEDDDRHGDGGDGGDSRDRRLVVEIFNEKNFFFDMFPCGTPSTASRPASSCGGSVTSEVADGRRRKGGSADGSSNLDEGPSGVAPTEPVDEVEVDDMTKEPSGEWLGDRDGDEALGAMEIRLGAFERRRLGDGAVASDAWYTLCGARTGEIRVRMVLWAAPDGSGRCKQGELTPESILREQLYRSDSNLEDHYGFRVPSSCIQEWAHLRSYQECREQRRITEWETAFGSQFFEHLNPRAGGRDYEIVKRLARQGIPRHWRQRVYMAMSGARERKNLAPPSYYKDLTEKIDTQDTVSFRQIELDIGRTFGHSGTKVSTEAGRTILRRVLKAYSIHNPAVGYCQGLNFIVGFLSLLVDEESTFWLLSVICEVMYPGYYIPTMADTQTDMHVLKQLIADDLPELDDFTADVGLPLELLGSQWLLCLFTTTFPSETVFRIFDCIMTEGSYFVFPVIMAHLRRLEPSLVGLEDFQTVLSTMKDAENALFDADEFIGLAVAETSIVTEERVANLRAEHSVSVRDEMLRADRARALNRQLAVVYQIPAFSSTAANLLRFFHQEAEVSTRSDVAFLLTLLCHGLVWLAEHSKRLRR